MPLSIKHADIACNFFEAVLKHTADEWYGQPFDLAPWQEEALTEIFGQLDEEGHRRIKMAYFEVPKKSGKTEWAAGLVLLVLMTDPNPGCQVYGAAAATRQAMNVYRAACKMVEQNKFLRQRLRLLRGTNRIVRRDDPDSFYAAVAADGDLSDGVNPSFVIADELHRWRTRKQLENWDVLALGGITRRQPLIIAITTAGVQNESPLAWRLHEKTRRIEEGIVRDSSFLGRIYGADAKDDWSSEATWIKANPSLKENGGFLDIAKTREQYEASLSDPESQRAFRRYYLNIWDQKEHGIHKRELRDGMPFRSWVEQGFVEASTGNVIDYRDVKARLEWGAELFELREICFDPWNSRQLSVPLMEEGYPCFEVRQGIAFLSEPSKKLLELVASEKLYHGGHPVLRWHASCVAAKEINDNLVFTKPKRTRNAARIDGIAATVNALARAMILTPQKQSVYETRGVDYI